MPACDRSSFRLQAVLFRSRLKAVPRTANLATVTRRR